MCVNKTVGQCMSNSIETLRYNQKFVFEDITNRQAPSDYWLKSPLPPTIPQKHEQTQQTENGDTYNVTGFKIITPEEARKTHNTKVIGLSVAGATIVTGLGVFALMRGGGNKKLHQGLNALKSYFEKKIETIKIDNKKIETMDKIYMRAINVIDNLMEKSEAVNNFTTFKDLLFKKIMHVTDFTGKIHDGITKQFIKIGRRAVESSYSDTENKIISALGESRKTTHRILLEKPEEIIEINGKKDTKTNWVKLLRSLDEEFQDRYYKDFDLNALKKRYYTVNQIAQSLGTKLSKLKNFFSTDVYKKFIADGKIAKEKEAIIRATKQQRKGISYAQNEMIKASEFSLRKVASFISFRDDENRQLLKSIMQELKNCQKYPKDRTAANQKILEAIEQLSENLKSNKVERFIDNDKLNVALAELNIIKNNMTGYKQGVVEDILTIYKHLLPENEYKKIKETYLKSVKSLDKSIKLETEDFTNKLRDLTMGSAPTDMLTMVGSLGVLGYHLGKSDDNDQRTSIALKYGFPALAGIAVSLYCNAKLFAGSKSLIVGSISTWVLNKIGTSSDNYIKKRKAARQNMA